jgi:4-hydroxythreonine-4-phosphate dehydrogenase
MKIAVTPGEPAGIGPDLTIDLAYSSWPAKLVVFADPNLMKARAKQLNKPLKLIDYRADKDQPVQKPGELYIHPIEAPATVIPGELNSENGRYVVETLSQAGQANISGEFDAAVTGPVHKGIINKSGVSFSGHTEFFAQQANTNDVVMLLVTEGLRVAMVTTHIPLAYVAKAITAERLEKVIRIIHSEFRLKFGIEKPQIYVCGLNPHAGEGGHLGSEEIETIEPTLEALRDNGISLVGPLPADTIFQPKYTDQADVILAMYHDQGLPVLKHKGFGSSVNITLGLPFIRTSVDHGTALDLAGTGEAHSGSFKLAVQHAIDMASYF